MKKLELTVSLRDKKGSGAAGRLRRSGKIPAVVYGKSGTQLLSVEEKTFTLFKKEAAGAVVLIDLKGEGFESKLAVVQEFQRNPLTDRYEHIDFHEISPDEEMVARLPVHVIGESIGVKNENGLLEVHVHSVDVRCLPAKLPEFIEVDVTNLHTGSAIYIGDLKALDGVVFTGNPEIVVVACSEQKTGGASSESTEEESAAEGAA